MKSTEREAQDADLGPLAGASISAGETITFNTWASLSPGGAERTQLLEGGDTGELPEAPVKHGASGAISDLEIVSLIGKGGMGEVHAAIQRSLGRQVAVKRPLRQEGTSTGVSLVNEARLTGMLEHPNIPPIHSLCRDGGRPVLVMKLIDGVAWSVLIRDPDHPAWRNTSFHKDPPLVRHVEILSAVCDALHYAHSHGVVHRDLKPENVMVGAFGEVYLLDWGVAAKTADLAQAQPPQPIVGTASYMAPEMTHGQADERSDVYLAGAVLHEVLTGERRHQGESLMMALLSARLSEPYDYPSDLPEELVSICRRATQPEPEDRYGSILELRGALRDWLRHRGAEQLAEESERRLARARESEAERGTLLAECRFGFMQALREHPDFPRAKQGLRDCLLYQLERELDHGNLAGAEEILEELGHDEVPAELAEGLEELRRERARQLELQEMAQEMDASVARRERFIFLTGAILLTVPMWIWTFSVDRSGDPGVVSLRSATYPTVTLAILAMAAVAFWRRLAKNRMSRQWLITLLAIIFAWLISRLVGLRFGVSLPVAISLDLVLMGLGMAVLAVWSARWVLAGVVTMVAAVGAVAIWPELYLKAFLAAFLVNVVWLGLGWWRRWGMKS